MSNSPKVERKLAAIMFTDIVGFTELTSTDEEKALSLVDKKRDLLLPLINKYDGKLIKEMGDGTLSQYNKLNNAIDCANNFQSNTDEKLQVRAGIHSGEVIFKNNDVFGDVVNVASRLESIAKPKSVLVSKETIDKLENTEGLEFVSLGLQSLKGVGRLIEVYALKDDNVYTPHPDDYKENEVKAHSDDEVPSIAIIPFKNKGAEEDVFYAYGISADLIADCSGAGLIRVATLASIEKIKKYDELETQELASKLLVRYIAEGTLWKMGEMFQLSIELYDTKESKVVWSDRWQEKWDNLPTIKGNLSDGLLKALDMISKLEKKAETTNTEAYELYLKAKYNYEKRIDTNDTEKARKLLRHTIELDDNMIDAKVLLGLTYSDMGDNDEAMEIFITALEQAEELGYKNGIGASLNNIGIVHWNKGDYEKALEYYDRALEQAEELGNKNGMGGTLVNIGLVHINKGDYDKALEYYSRSLTIREEIGDKRGMGLVLPNIGNVHYYKGDYNKALEYYSRSLKIQEEIGDKYGMGLSLNNIGNVHWNKGDYEKALEYYDRALEQAEELGNKYGMGQSLNGIGNVHYYKGDYNKALEYYSRSLTIREEIGDKRGMGYSLNSIGVVHYFKGDYNKALEYYSRSLAIQEELGDKRGMGYSLNSIGIVHYNRGEYNRAVESLEKSLATQKEVGLKVLELFTTTYLYLCYRHLSRDYDEQDIHSLIKETENIEFDLNFRLYQLLKDKSYLEKAYKQIQEKVDAMDDELKEKFLNYPIPKQIIEEYNKV